MFNLCYMSLQRVFESARRLGLPVVVTDPAGRDPFVLLPLDQFEAMAGSSIQSASPEREPRNAKNPLNTAEKSTPAPTSPAPSVRLPESEEIPLEERFYLETAEGEREE